MSHDTQDKCKIWRKTNLFFQKWQEFGKFWSEHSKVSNIYNLIGPFHKKYVMFDLKKYRWVIFHDTENDVKFEENLTCCLENNMRNLANFHQSTWSWNSKLGLLWGTFIPSRNCTSLKFTGELCVTTMKKDTKFEKELANLKNFHFNGLL